MDSSRRIGGVLWVGGGVVFGVIAAALGWQRPGPVTWVLAAAVVLLTVVSFVRADSRTSRVAGWLVAVLFAGDFAGSVADRFGVLGKPGEAGVSWGTWQRFTDYTATLLHHPGHVVVEGAGVAATILEVALAVLLVSGWQRRWAGKATAGLLVIYLVAMATGPEHEGVARYAMPVLVGGALLLSATPAGALRGAHADRTAATPDRARAGR